MNAYAIRAVALICLLLLTPRASAAQESDFCPPDQVPTFNFGFADLKAYVGDAMGDPITCQYDDPSGNGDALQDTTTGSALWRQSDGSSIFTSGDDHWAITPSGPVAWNGPDLDPPVAPPDTLALQQIDAPPVSTAAPSPASIYWGVYHNGVPASIEPLDALEATLGKQVSIVHWGQSWGLMPGNPFQTARYELLRSRGSIPMINWGSWQLGRDVNQPDFRLSVIASGTYDSYIRSWADSARAWGHPFFLRFDQEMNGDWQFPWSVQRNGNQPADYVRAWRHVHDIFVQEGATNATWVWCPNISGTRTVPLDQVYPGDDYVNWTCLDLYNFGTDHGDAWQAFGQVLEGTALGGYNPHNSYQELVNLAPSKPIMLGEVASSEHGGSKPDWITDMLQTLPTSFPQIRAVIWTDWDTGDGSTWPISSSPQAQSAFANGISSDVYASNQFANLPAGPIQALAGFAPAPAPSQNQVALGAIADTYTSRAQPTSTAAGSSSTLRADVRGTDTAFLEFDLGALRGKTVTSATLRLHTSSESYARSGSTFDVWLVPSTDWKEQYVTYRNSPQISGTALGTLSAPGQPNTWYGISLDTGTVQNHAGGLLAVAINATSGDVWVVNSRESGSATAPQLVVNTR